MTGLTAVAFRLITEIFNVVVCPLTIRLGVKDLLTCTGVNMVVGSTAVLLPAKLGASPPPDTEAVLVKLVALPATLTRKIIGGYTEPGCRGSALVQVTGGLLAQSQPTLPNVSTKVSAGGKVSVTVTNPLVGAAPLLVTTKEYVTPFCPWKKLPLCDFESNKSGELMVSTALVAVWLVPILAVVKLPAAILLACDPGTMEVTLTRTSQLPPAGMEAPVSCKLLPSAVTAPPQLETALAAAAMVICTGILSVKPTPVAATVLALDSTTVSTDTSLANMLAGEKLLLIVDLRKTMTVSEALLLPWLANGSPALTTLAVLASELPAPMSILTVTVMSSKLCPAARESPREQVLPTQVQFVPLMLTNVMPAGTTSVTVVLPVLGETPTLVTRKTNAALVCPWKKVPICDFAMIKSADCAAKNAVAVMALLPALLEVTAPGARMLAWLPAAVASTLTST